MKVLFLSLLLTFPVNEILHGQSDPYFPPMGTGEWETITPGSLGWNADAISSLSQFLGEKNTKAFIVLHKGRIVLEEYFGTFTADSIWYWASAGKTITAFLIGKAQEEGYLSVNDTASDYLGQGWTSMSTENERRITLRHQLTMTTGLETTGVNWDCTDPECLSYRTAPGERWFYHNAPYTLLKDVLSTAVGKSANLITYDWLNQTIGMGGAWIQADWNNVYFSTARDMARFGHLILNNGDWNGVSILKDKQYIYDMTHPSQQLNPAYGYLFWLNGSDTYRQPGLDFSFQGSIVPSAPDDLFAGLGKNDQKMYIVPSRELVVIRMGNAADEDALALSGFDESLWVHLNEVIGETTSITYTDPARIRLFPNPASDRFRIESSSIPDKVRICDLAGNILISKAYTKDLVVSELPKGMYLVQITLGDDHFTRKLFVGQ